MPYKKEVLMDIIADHPLCGVQRDTIIDVITQIQRQETSITVFNAQCAAYSNMQDAEVFHSKTDTLMEDTLIALGYAEGIDIIYSHERRYS